MCQPYSPNGRSLSCLVSRNLSIQAEIPCAILHNLAPHLWSTSRYSIIKSQTSHFFSLVAPAILCTYPNHLYLLNGTVFLGITTTMKTPLWSDHNRNKMLSCDFTNSAVSAFLLFTLSFGYSPEHIMLSTNYLCTYYWYPVLLGTSPEGSTIVEVSSTRTEAKTLLFH